MILANGDVTQYRELKKISIVDYLVRLNTFVEQHEHLTELKESKKNK